MAAHRGGPYLARLPDERPPGLRLAAASGPWYRIDHEPPGRWKWAAPPAPMARFDSAAGALRVRYAATSRRGALRERFDASGRIVSAGELDHHLVELTGRLHLLDLRREVILDALGLDDQISTSRAPGVWAAAQRLTDLVAGWFGAACHGIAYRSRTTPEHAANLAFFPHAPLQARSLGRLRAQQGLLAAAVASDGFAVEAWPDEARPTNRKGPGRPHV